MLVADHRRARVYVTDRAKGGFALDDVLHAGSGSESPQAERRWAEGLRAHLLAARRRFEFRHLVLIAPRRLLQVLRAGLDEDLGPTLLAAVPHARALPPPLRAVAPVS